MSDTSTLPPDLERLPDMDEAWREANPGRRLEAVRRAGRRLRERIATAGKAAAVRTYSIATFPYPTKFAFQGAALSPAPYVMLRNRMQLVQVERDGRLINILVNPTDPDRSAEAPFFKRQIERYGETVSRRLLSRFHNRVTDALRQADVAPEEIDYITFDHLHVQDVRGLLGTQEPEPGSNEPTPALLPNARLLVQRPELAVFDCPHPMQRYWYVPDGIRSVAPDKIVALDGDYMIGAGFAVVRTPGHTTGNHSIVLHTDDGLWTISENGVAVESYAPTCSEMPGLRRFARDAEVEVVLNGNTRDDTLDQYISMVLEKTLADPCRERPEFPQHFPSSEIVKSRLAPGLAPTFTYRKITHGAIRTARGARGGASSAA